MPVPTVTTVTQPLGTYGSVTLTTNQYEMTAESSTSALAINLAQGAWRVTAGMGSRPKQGLVLPSFDSGVQVFTAGGGVINLPAMFLESYLDMDAGAGDVFFWVNLYQQGATGMTPVASTWTGNEADSAITLPAAPAAATAQVGWGADSNWGEYTGAGATLAMIPFPNLVNIFSTTFAFGIRTVRVPVIWQYLAPTGTQGQAAVFNATAQANYDTIFNAINAAGLKVLIGFGALAPQWATAGGTGAWGSPPANWADYATFVTAALTRWGANVTSVEGPNEPNGFTASGPGSAPTGGVNTTNYPGWTVANLSSDQQNLYTAAKAYSAAIKVGTCGIAYGDSVFLANLYATAGWKGNYDYVSCHPYPIRFDKKGTSFAGNTVWGLTLDPAYPWGDSGNGLYNGFLSGLAQLRKVMVANAESAKTIRVTEIGWHTDIANQNVENPTFLYASEPEQAGYLRTVMCQAARLPYVDMLFFWSAHDNTLGSTLGPASTYAGGAFGLMDALGTRIKAGGYVVQSTITAIAGGTG